MDILYICQHVTSTIFNLTIIKYINPFETEARPNNI
jgi:hypothetical protein